MTRDARSAEHYVAARRLAERGYRVIICYGKGGLWVRNPDLTKPDFADHNSFISFATAKVLLMRDGSYP